MFGSYLKRARENAVTQRQLAEQTRTISQVEISYIESGKRVPTKEQLETLCQTMKLDKLLAQYCVMLDICQRELGENFIDELLKHGLITFMPHAVSAKTPCRAPRDNAESSNAGCKNA